MDNCITLATLPPPLLGLADTNIQSITFELCGNDFPELVKYDFAQALVPLYYTTNSGNLKPFLHPVDIPQTITHGLEEEFWTRVRQSWANHGPININETTFQVTLNICSQS